MLNNNYTIDFAKRQQTRNEYGTQRQVLLHLLPPPLQYFPLILSPPSFFLHVAISQIMRGTWFWYSDSGMLVPYSETTATVLENAYKQYLRNSSAQSVSVSSDHTCTIDGRGPSFWQKRNDGHGNNPKGREVRRGFIRIEKPRQESSSSYSRGYSVPLARHSSRTTRRIALSEDTTTTTTTTSTAPLTL